MKDEVEYSFINMFDEISKGRTAKDQIFKELFSSTSLAFKNAVDLSNNLLDLASSDLLGFFKFFKDQKRMNKNFNT